TIVIPSTPADAAGLLWTAMQGEDPVMFLIPKHLLWAEHEYAEPIRAVPLGRARQCTSGSDVTVVAWGNTIEKSLEAIAAIEKEISVELIDLRSIVPWDKGAIKNSVHKTRRLVVVQEDTENCSVGQMIISHVTSTPELWNAMISPPILVGEGIRNATVVSLLKKSGDPVALDDELCEVETDKAVYPIQSSFAGVMGEWKTKVGDTVDIGQELGTLFTDEESLADQFEVAAEVSEKRKPVEAAASAARPGDGDRAQHARRNSIEPALSPTVTRKLSHVIPANL